MISKLSDIKIAVIGLGYVGLPLAVEFAKTRNVCAYDINASRIDELSNFFDKTHEVDENQLKAAKSIQYTNELNDLCAYNTFIITVPTPIDENNLPNLNPLKEASSMIGKILKKDNIVIYESTVYPGATEEVCIPILEKQSGLRLNKDFYVGYSPERVNPGDKENTLTSIVKITSGSTPEISNLIDEMYSSIIKAGTYMASSIKVAEAAKVIENTQRDLNIATINEFAKIFNVLNIDTQEVLKAAETKWNFLPFKPGLVGGHCISVDPYYLTYKAKEVGYDPEVILAGRRINNDMPRYCATQLVKHLTKKKIHIDDAKVLVLGITFKGDCPDIRNTKIVNLILELEEFNIQVDVHDNWASEKEVKTMYDIDLVHLPKNNSYDAILIAVDHSEYREWGKEKIKSFGKDNSVIYDLKYVLSIDDSDYRL